MAYIDVVRKHESNNQFKYNHKEIYKQVRKAMKNNGEADASAHTPAEEKSDADTSDVNLESEQNTSDDKSDDT